ncbi:MAG TPA: ribosome maturation factor RimP [Solirubrobacterales bacterium]|nr:ribosome maturation factor RimP [Solirubrobacterales bacterium]
MTRPSSQTSPNAERPATTPRAAELQAGVETRLAAVEPDVEVLAVERAGSARSPVLRIFVDRPGGVDLELCARVTTHLRDLLTEYGIEVSSPGPERPLSKLDHYRRFLHHRVRVRTLQEIEGRKDFKGELVGADDEAVTLAGAWGTIRIPHERIRRSNLMPENVPASAEGAKHTTLGGRSPRKSRTTGRV